MAKVNISYNCGCGFRTDNIAEAVLHSDIMNHTLTVVGDIIRDKKKESNDGQD